MSTIDGDDNDNTINGTSSNENIRGKGGQDTINGGAGDDTISGGSGNDSIDGGTGNDTIYGGDGNDTITGGGGNDVIVGGKGDDTLTAGNNSQTDTFVIRDGDGNDTITDFDPGEPDIIRFEMAEISTYQDVVDRMSMDGSDTIITYDDGSFTRLVNVNSGSLSSTNFQFGAGPVCLAKGTLIETPSGRRRIEMLRPGDFVMTLDRGPQPVVEVVTETIRFRDKDDRRKPVRIAAGALGRGVPERDTVVSPQHRVLIPSGAADPDVLIAAVKLTHRKGVRRMWGCREITYFNLLLERHEIILAQNCAVESLLVTPRTAAKLAALDLNVPPAATGMVSARPIVTSDPSSTLCRAGARSVVA